MMKFKNKINSFMSIAMSFVFIVSSPIQKKQVASKNYNVNPNYRYEMTEEEVFKRFQENKESFENIRNYILENDIDIDWNVISIANGKLNIKNVKSKDVTKEADGVEEDVIKLFKNFNIYSINSYKQNGLMGINFKYNSDYFVMFKENSDSVMNGSEPDVKKIQDNWYNVTENYEHGISREEAKQLFRDNKTSFRNIRDYMGNYARLKQQYITWYISVENGELYIENFDRKDVTKHADAIKEDVIKLFENCNVFEIHGHSEGKGLDEIEFIYHRDKFSTESVVFIENSSSFIEGDGDGFRKIEGDWYLYFFGHI